MSYLADYISFDDNKAFELAPGVLVERRGFIKLSALSLFLCYLGSKGALKAEEKVAINKEGYSFKQFITDLLPVATSIVADEKADEEKYLIDVLEKTKKITDIELAQKTDQKIRFTSMCEQSPLKVYQIRMLPGAVLPCHDHRDYNGIIRVLEGSAHIRNFNIVDDKKAALTAEEFKIQETQNFVAKVNDITSLSRQRDNIHEIIAGEQGVLFLDIFTFYNKSGTSKYLQYSQKPIDEKNKIYLASWRK